MEIEGTYTLQAPAEDIWKCLMDQQVIQHTIPGLERLTKVDEQTYTFAINIRHAPLRGTYTGRASVLEPSYPSAYRLTIEGEGPAHAFQCDFSIKLGSHNENTVVSYHGTVQPGGNTRISAPLIKATMKVLLQQFFTALADRLRTERQSPVYVTTLEEMYEMPFMEEQISEQLMAIRQRGSQPTLLHRLVHRAGLGQHNPALEEQWVKRLRQVGLLTVFLLLVWVGTRLPRRTVSA